MKYCLYSSIDDVNLFERVGFYRDDISALRLNGAKVLATNSLIQVFCFRPYIIVGYFYSKSLVVAILGRLIGSRVLLTGGADQISPALLQGYRLFNRRVIAFLCLLFANKILLSCSDDLVNFKKLCFGIFWLEDKIVFVNHVVIPAPVIRPFNPHKSNQFSAFTLCWMGSISNVKRKGVDRAIKLVGLLRQIGVDATLDIAGSNGPGKRYLEDLINKINLNPYVKLLGPISEEEKNKRFSSGHVYLQISEHEGFGVAAAEAFFSGMVVIHSNRGGLSDVIGENGVILDPLVIDRGNTNEINEFYLLYLDYRVNNDYLKNMINDYSLKMRSDAFLKYGNV
ncbi:glycosyltransferase family 4 protein [Rhodoferax sp. PAMC 29310]|uniref:glycosyltransferase family 4 protein n=1 Tax=Rhodoferax sp. PAMC 29310 TaxID=2822760 RepID=UPI001B336235|nr:glycosyltransferase family 4 protein [Rhodoferax sp. PAMC 29310]